MVWSPARQEKGFPGGSDSEESACNVGDLGLIPSSGRFSGKGMTVHSSILVWRIPWTEEPGRLQPVGWQRVTTEPGTVSHGEGRAHSSHIWQQLPSSSHSLRARIDHGSHNLISLNRSGKAESGGAYPRLQQVAVLLKSIFTE